MKQWFLFTGENEYERNAERSRWTRGFSEKHGSENISAFEASSLSMPALMDAVSTAPFIAEKRLVVMNGLPRIEKTDVEELIKATHPGVLVLCIDASPDKRLGSTKAFLEHLEVRDFTPRSHQEIHVWLQSLSKALGVNLAVPEANVLIDRIGEDQSMLSSELTKIATYAGRGSKIEMRHIDDLIMFRAERAVWQLMDHFSAGKEREALSLARNILLRGENPHGLWSKLLWMVTQVVLVSAAVDRGLSQPAAIAKEAGVPFPTARNLAPFAGSVSKEKLRLACAWFAEADKGLKLGAYRATLEAPEELNTLIDRGIIALSGLSKRR